MRLGLLVVLAVAVFLPSLSEGRTVSRCELKKKLGDKLILSKKLQPYKEDILKLVICNVEFRTHLNTDWIKVIGYRPKTTTAKPTTTKPTTRPVTTQPAATELATEPEATELMTEPMTTESVTERMTNESTIEQMTTESTIKRMTTESTIKRMTTESMNKQMTTESPTELVTSASATAEATTSRSNRTAREAGNIRKKRAADTTTEESDSTDVNDRLEGMLDEEEIDFDEDEIGQDDNRMEDDDEESEEEDEAQDELDDGVRRKKRFLRRWRPRRKFKKHWSLGFYGIFQLSDSHFCNSGYRWSRNKCGTSCSAFTDNDIADDIDCVVKTHYWRWLIWKSPRKCVHTSTQKFFEKCD